MIEIMLSIGMGLLILFSVYVLIENAKLLEREKNRIIEKVQKIYNLNLDLENFNLKFNNDAQEFCKSVAGAIYENDDILKYDKYKNLAYNYLVLQEVVNIMLKNQYKEKQ